MNAGLRVALGFMVLTFWARGQNASEVDLTPEIGPHSGDVTWSLRNHILTWNTPQLTLNLDPWFTLRHVSGTMSPLTQSPPTLTLDNLRGAHFDAQLDGIWRIEGSLEEMQGYIGAWEAVTMEEITALPGWGRAKIKSDGRVDVARARVISSCNSVSSQGDSLSFIVAYAPLEWGNLPSPITFSDQATSFPRASLAWVRPQQIQAKTTVARWTGTDRGPVGGSTEGLFRQTDACWTDLQWEGLPRWAFGMLGGAMRARPWIGELEEDSLNHFDWRPWLSMTTSWTTKSDHIRIAGEWASHQGWGLAATWRPKPSWFVTASTTRLLELTGTSISLLNAGTPVSAVLRPAGLTKAVFRNEFQFLWTNESWKAGGNCAMAGTLLVAEAWLGFCLHRVWPLHVTLGAEIWQGAASSNFPSEGARLRVGLSHQLGMTPGSTTFTSP